MRECVHAEYRAQANDHWWFRARRRIFDALLDPIVPAGRAARILDLGPGSGVNLPVLAPRGEVTVVDRDLGSLTACASLGAVTIQADAGSIPLPDASFDLACALDVIEHLDDDRQAVRELRRLVRPGGRVLVTVPALRALWGRQDVLAEHRRRYRRRELRQLLEGAGWVVDRLSYFNTLLFPPIFLVRVAMRPFLSHAARDGHSDLAVRLPFGMDRALESVFAAERHWLKRFDLPIGVSLVALAHREATSP